jgi:hypothetical protein
MTFDSITCPDRAGPMKRVQNLAVCSATQAYSADRSRESVHKSFVDYDASNEVTLTGDKQLVVRGKLRKCAQISST